jgi:peroxiredoxin
MACRTQRFIIMAVILMQAALIVFGQGSEPKTQKAKSALPSAAEDIRPLMINVKMPPLSLLSAEGKTVDLNNTIAKKPAILIFYRGGWCKYCNTQLDQLQVHLPRFEELGYQVIAISPDSTARIQERQQVRRYSYLVLSDNMNTASQAFGIAFKLSDALHATYKAQGADIEAASGQKDHILPVPAVFIIGIDGTIKFVYANPDYTRRIDMDVLVKAAETVLEPGRRSGKP